MNRIEFSNYISHKVPPYFEPLGFSYIKSKYAFLKKNKEGWIRISFGFYQFAETNNFNVSFEVRRNIVEEIVVKYVDINPSEHKNTSTVLFILSSLLGHKYKGGVFEFTTLEKLDEIIEKEVLPFFQIKLPMYSEQYVKLENIYRLYTDPKEENNKVMHFGFENCVRTLVIGHLLFPNNFNQVVEICESKMSKNKQKWPSSLDIELFDAKFYNIASSLIINE